MLALGSEPRMNIVPGASELAVPFNSLEDALVSQATLLSFMRYAWPLSGTYYPLFTYYRFYWSNRRWREG